MRRQVTLWLLFIPLFIVVVYPLIGFACDGTIEGAPLEDYQCFGSHEAGMIYFAWGLFWGIVILPLSIITTIIGVILLVRWKHK